MTQNTSSPGDRSTSTYGVFSLTLLVVASMVGTGVFTTSGFTLGVVGSSFGVMLCWIIGAAIAVCGAVAYGRLARLLPQSGGEYLYLSANIHPFAGFLAGWVSLTAAFSGSIAAAAVAFERYALPPESRPAFLPPDVIAILLVLVCGFAHGRHINPGKYFQNAVVCLKCITLLIFLSWVLAVLPSHQWHWLSASDDAASTGSGFWTAVSTSVVWISLSYAGFNAAIYVAGESTDAGRSVPKALLLGTVSVSLLYLLLNLVFITSAPAEKLVWKEDIAAIAGLSIGGESLAWLVRGTVALALLSSVSGMIMSGPRVYAKMSDDGVFPPMFSTQNGGIGRSVYLQTAIAIGLILLQRFLVWGGWLESSLLGLLIYLSTTLSVSSALCASTLFLPSVRRQEQPHGPLSDMAVVVYVVATLAAVLLMAFNHEVEGQPRGLWHLTGIILTMITGTLAWVMVGRQRVR